MANTQIHKAVSIEMKQENYKNNNDKTNLFSTMKFYVRDENNETQEFTVFSKTPLKLIRIKKVN